MSYIGLDIGLTGVKAVVFSITGEVLVRSYDDYGKDYKDCLLKSKEIDPIHVLEGVKRVLKKCRCLDLEDLPKTLAVSVSSDDVFPADSHGKPLNNVLSAFSAKGHEYREYIADMLGGPDRIFDITGQLLYTDIAGLIRIIWMIKNIDGLLKKTWKFLSWQAYINYVFTGEAVTDYSDASRFLTFDINTKKWSKGILDKLDIPIQVMPEVKPAGSIVGPIKQDIAGELGLPRGLSIITGGFDQASAALGAGVVKKGIFSLGMGTVLASHWLVDDFRSLHFREYAYSSYLDSHHYMGLISLWNGNSVINWFYDYIAGFEKKLYKDKVYDFFDSKMIPSPSSLFFMPHLAGSAYPNYDPYSRGAIIGLDLVMDKTEVLKSIYEGIGFELKQNYIGLSQRTNIEIKELRAVGGGSRSKIWAQILANILEQSIMIPEIYEGGCLACAMLGAVALKDFQSIEDAAAHFIHIKEIIDPQDKHSCSFHEKFTVYRDMYENLKKYNHYLVQKASK